MSDIKRALYFGNRDSFQDTCSAVGALGFLFLFSSKKCLICTGLGYILAIQETWIRSSREAKVQGGWCFVVVFVRHPMHNLFPVERSLQGSEQPRSGGPAAAADWLRWAARQLHSLRAQ